MMWAVNCRLCKKNWSYINDVIEFMRELGADGTPGSRHMVHTMITNIRFSVSFPSMVSHAHYGTLFWMFICLCFIHQPFCWPTLYSYLPQYVIEKYNFCAPNHQSHGFKKWLCRTSSREEIWCARRWANQGIAMKCLSCWWRHSHYSMYSY